MKNGTKIVALALALLMLLSACALAEGDREVLDVIILPGAQTAGRTPFQDTPIEQFLEEKFDLNITVAQVDWYNLQQRNIYIASGNPFDMALSVGVKDFVDIGAVRPITKEMIETYAPNIWADLQEYDTGDMYANTYYYDELWGVPEFAIQSVAPYTMICRRDWMETLGYSEENLNTLQDYENLFLAVRNNDPDGNGVKDTFGIGLYNTPFTWNSFGYWFAYYGVRPSTWQKVDGQLTYANVTEGYKEALKLLHRWYELEIIDPDFATDPRATTLEKFAHSKLFSFEGFPGHIASNGATQQQLAAANPEATWTWLAGPMNEEGKRAAAGGDLYKGTSCFFGADTSDEKVARLLEMLDYLVNDYEGARLNMFGFEGESYEVKEDGSTAFIGDYVGNLDKQYELGTGLFMAQYTSQVSNVVRNTAERNVVLNWALENLDGISVDYHPVFSEEAIFAASDLNSSVNEYFFKAVIGEVDIDATWDEYVANWYANGGEQLTKEAREQYPNP